MHRHPDAGVLWSGFGKLGDNVKIAVFIENPGVGELKLGVLWSSCPVSFHQLRVRKSFVRVLIKVLEVGVTRCGVEIVVVFLDVLTVVALVGGEAEHSFFENGVVSVPKGQAKIEDLIAVAVARQPILAPSVGLAASQVVRKVGPGIAVSAVIFPYRGPRSFRKVRTPPSPGRNGRVVAFKEALAFRIGFCGRAHLPIISDNRRYRKTCLPNFTSTALGGKGCYMLV
jgi:hypothetical protein